MINNKISIIVPIYNSEKFIADCIESLINQTYQNIEIILINDGSSDNSYEICKKYQSIDSRIRLVSQVNSGVSKARNKGIEVATGHYIMFVDSDDYADKQLCELLISRNKDSYKDMVFCSYLYINAKSGEMIKLPKYDRENNISSVLDLAGENFNFFYLNLYFNSPVCKLYRYELVKNVIFNSELSLGEDLLFNLDFLEKCEKISFVNEALYFYRIGGGNSLSSKNYKNRLEMVKTVFDRSQISFRKLFKENYNEDLIKANYFIEVCLSIKKMLSSSDVTDKEKMAFLASFLYSEQMRELAYLKVDCWSYLPIQYKLFYILLSRKALRTLFHITRIFNFIKS